MRGASRPREAAPARPGRSGSTLGLAAERYGTGLEPRWRGLLPRSRPAASGAAAARSAPPVQQAVYELDGTYRRVFNLTLLNMELLFESLDVERPDFTLLLTAEVRFDMDVSSGVVWQRRSVH